MTPRAPHPAPAPTPDQEGQGILADALVLTFTPGVSLRMWADEGLLEREWALCERVRHHYARLLLVTYGDGRDLDIAAALPGAPEVICNDARLPDHDYVRSIPGRVVDALRDARSVLVKTNQNQGGSVAVDVATALRRAGVRTALVARGGYLRSRFRAWEHGADSADARHTADEEGRLCRAADIVIGPQPMIDDLAWRFAIPASRTGVVPNFVLVGDDPVTDPAHRDASEVLFAGRLVHQKRIDVLIDALAIVRHVGLDARLTIVGDGPLRADLESRARERALAATFHPREPHPTVLARMRRCALYAQAAAYEGGSPKTVLEAMAAGAAVVAANTYGTGSCISSDVTGLSTPLSAPDMARAIARLLQDAPLRRRLGTAAAAWARAEHGLPVIVERELAAHRRAFDNAAAREARPAAPAAPRSDPGVTVIMPVLEAGPHFDEALRSIQAQTHTDLDILIVPNGSSSSTRDRVADAARADPRIRVERLERANLAAALNHAVRAARHPFVARMDADDLSAPDRIARQLAFMHDHPALAAAGTAYEIIDEQGNVLDALHPPTDPRDLRWSLLLGNTCAHGSMMLRRDAILGAGAYDETLDRAQDYDLWLRLSRTHAITNLPNLLYRHRLPPGCVGLGATSPAQAEAAARLMLDEWKRLDVDGVRDTEIVRALAATLAGAIAPPDCAAEVTFSLRDGHASLSGLIALLWARERASRGAERAHDAALRARLRELGAVLRDEGVESLWLVGAGDHTSRLLSHAADLAIPIAGILDDTRPGRRLAQFRVEPTTAARPGDHALLSSDWHEDTLWQGSAPMRARGVHVWRLYGNGDGAPRVAHARAGVV